jgi:hypothetical protein
MPPRKKQGAGVSHKEVGSLLDVIEEVLPLGQGEWDTVERQHHSMYPDAGRTRDALKQKFAKLHLKKIPTGDQNCPPEVRRAKSIYKEMKKKADFSDGEEGAGQEVSDIEQDIHQGDDNNNEGVENDEDEVGIDFLRMQQKTS